MTKEEKIRLRYRARTDLYWLVTEILGNKDLVERVHRPVVNHFYQLKPGTRIEDISKDKGMSLYDQRGAFKTTIMEGSAIQLLLNYPNIRLFLGAGKLDRSSDSLVAIKRQFQANRKLRALFPEFCPPMNAEWGTKTEFTLPNRTDLTLRDPSVMAFSLDSIKAGPHCDVLFLDDAVHQDNVGTPEQMRATIHQYAFLTPIIEPYGYRHIIGTPYNDSDLYAWLEENDPEMRKFRRAAWTITNPNWVEGLPLTEKDVTLLFPERFSFDELNKMRMQNEYVFNCQYLCDPTPKDSVLYTDNLLITHTIPQQHIPRNGVVFQTWDFGFTNKSYSDFSVGATGLYDTKGNLFILDIVLGKWLPYELVNQVAMFAVKWRPLRIGIEAASGSQLIQPALDNLQRQWNRHFNVDWLKTSPQNKKRERISSMQPLMRQDKFYFSSAINPEVMAEVRKQFIKFPHYAHDDAPDAISMLLQYRGSFDYAPSVDPFGDSMEEPIYSVSFDPDDDSGLGAGIVG